MRSRLKQVAGCLTPTEAKVNNWDGPRMSSASAAARAEDLGEFGAFLAAEFESLQSRVLARLEQNLAGVDVLQRPSDTTLTPMKKSVSIDEDLPTESMARWGRLVSAAMEAEFEKDDQSSERQVSTCTMKNEPSLATSADSDEEIWTPHPDWQAMASQDEDEELTVSISRRSTVRKAKSTIEQGLFVDQLQTTYRGSEHTDAGMLEKSSDSWLARRVLHPDGAHAIVWCVVGLILMCYETTTIPLEAAGLIDKPSTALAVAILVYWALDVPVHALTGYMHDVTLEMRPSYTLRHYAKTWMAIDVLLVSLDCFFLVLEQGGAAQTLRLLRLLRMARLVRVERWNRMYKNLMIGRQSEMLDLVVRLAGLILALLVICHLVACTWYGIGDQLPGNGSWLEKGDFLMGSNARKYSVAFHWTITQFTPSTNNIHPQTTEERCFAILVVIMGMVVFSTFLGSLSSTVNEMRSYGSKLAQERHSLLVFTKQRGLTHVISQKILSFSDTEGRRERNVVTEADLPLLSQLPPAVQMGMRTELYFPSLRPHPLFAAVARGDMTFCVALCHKAMSEERHMAQQVVFVDGAECSRAYVTRSGLVEYIYQTPTSGRTQTFAMTAGSWLAECALWVEWSHRGLLVAQSSASLVTLDCDATRDLVGTHGPELRTMFKCFALLFAHEMDLNGRIVTDLAPPPGIVVDLTRRAMDFAQIQFPRADTQNTRVTTPMEMVGETVTHMSQVVFRLGLSK